jgi:hypothetical protein
MQEYGFRNGDNVISVDGITVDQRGDLIDLIVFDGKREVTLVRDGQEVK